MSDALTVETLRGQTVEWDEFVTASPEGSPFHLTAWQRAVRRAFGHRPHYLLARRAGQVEGVLPLFQVRGLLGGSALISVPYAVYGGVCTASPAARDALLDAARALAGQRGARYVELRQRSDLGLGLSTKNLYVTFRRTISGRDEDNLLAIPRKQRRMTRQGQKYGLRAERGRHHFDAFYAVYAESVRNLGSPVFPRALLRGVLGEFDKNAELFTVWRDDTLLAGVLILYFRDQVLPYYGGARRDALPYAVNDFMYWDVMCHAAANGYRVFDFGRSREGTGAYHFKRHWGFEPEPLPYQYMMQAGRSLPDLSPSNPRFALAVSAWKRLPLAITNVVGPFLTRYLP